MDLINILILVIVLPVAVVVGTVLRSSRRDAGAPPMRTAAPDKDLELATRGLLRGSRPNKIMAIKIVRERTGMGLREAKAYVDALGAGTFRDDTYARPGASVYDEAEGVIRGLRDVRGSKIEAIRRVRELTDLGLKEAKDFVDARWP